jgi:CheY-like chemotaxis protein
MNHSFLFNDYTILIVEDDLINREVLKYALNNLGLPIIEAVNGEQGLERLDELIGKPVILLLDLNMPVMDGYKVLQILGGNPQKYETVRTIVVSATLRSEFEKRGVNHLVHDYEAKPIKKESLVRKIIESTLR